jgi:hypothetical protein
MDILPFQQTAAANLRKAILDSFGSEEMEMIVMEAPTGAGKTLIVTEAIREILNDAVFLWLSYYPGINRQSKEKLESYGIPSNNLDEISRDSGVNRLEPGTIYFLNFQKLGGEKALEEGGDTVTPFHTLLQQARMGNIPVVAIVDEAHYGAQGATVMAKILTEPEYPLSAVVGVSATPEHFLGLAENSKGGKRTLPAITAKMVKESKLLKHDLEVTTSTDTGVDFGQHAITICRNALSKWKEIKDRWEAFDPEVQPALIVQVPNKFDEENAQFIENFRRVYEEATGNCLLQDDMRHCFGGACAWGLESIDPEEIEDAKQVKVVFFKKALSTGWDCPRAEMMISLRPAKDRTEIVQLVGRMLRNPKAFQVQDPENPDLDVAFLHLPFYDQKVLERIREEYTPALTGGVRESNSNRKLEIDPRFKEQEELILGALKELQTARRVWKGKNLASRVKELRDRLISTTWRKENVDVEGLKSKLSGWLQMLLEEIVRLCGDELRAMGTNVELDAIELKTIRQDSGSMKISSENLDPRDEIRCLRSLEDKIPRLREGVSEDLLREANDILKSDLVNNPQGLSYPIVRLHGKKKTRDILIRAVENCEAALRQVVEEIRYELGTNSGPRREMRRMAQSLINIDATVEYVPWDPPLTQTASAKSTWVRVGKAFHTWEGQIPKGSGPENTIREALERDPKVICYIRNPQKGKGLAIRYEKEDKSQQLTFPDFIVVEGDPKAPRIRIVEGKGMEERGTEQFKYKGLGEYGRMMEEEGVGLDTEWVEVIQGNQIRCNPRNIRFAERLQGQLFQ